MNKSIYILISILVGFLTGCSDSDNPTEEVNKSKHHIVFIGLDGWAGYNFDINRMHYVSSLLNEGVWTLEKQAVLPSGSAQNWCSMFMGTSPDIHGYTEWNSTSSSYNYSFEVKNNIFPTIFQVLKEQVPDSEIGVFFQWEGIKYFIDTLSVDYVKHIPLELGHVCITDSVKTYFVKKQPTLCAVIYDDPDHTGHQSGYFTEEYYSALEKLDTCIYDIINSVKQAGCFDETVFMITSDHGGKGISHGGNSPEEMNTPFIMFGRKVKRIGKVDTPMQQYDVASIIAEILDLKQPVLWIGDCHSIFFENNK